MKIAAILIGNSNVKPMLPGVISDLNKVQAYLNRPLGGAFEGHEIEISLNESKTAILQRLSRYRTYDYVFTLVAGHGEIRTSVNDTVLWIGDNEVLPINQLVVGCNRQTMVIDVCRKVVDDRKKAVTRLDSQFEAVAFSESYHRKEYRDKFERLVKATSLGLLKFYSCGPNQSAGDDGSGGDYTNALLSAAQMSQTTSTIYELHNKIKPTVRAANPPQQPEENIGRRMENDMPPFRITL